MTETRGASAGHVVKHLLYRLDMIELEEAFR
jgi:hypothetical protein